MGEELRVDFGGVNFRHGWCEVRAGSGFKEVECFWCEDAEWFCLSPHLSGAGWNITHLPTGTGLSTAGVEPADALLPPLLFLAEMPVPWEMEDIEDLHLVLRSMDPELMADFRALCREVGVVLDK